MHIKFHCTDGAFGPGIKSCIAKTHKQRTVGKTIIPAGLFVTATSKDGQTATRSIIWRIRPPRPQGTQTILSQQIVVQTGSDAWIFSQLLTIKDGTSSCGRPFGVPTCTPLKASTITVLRALDQATYQRLFALHTLDRKTGRRQTIWAVRVDGSGRPKISYELTNAWPSKVTVSTATAGDSGVASLTVTFSGEELTTVKGGPPA